MLVTDKKVFVFNASRQYFYLVIAKIISEEIQGIFDDKLYLDTEPKLLVGV